MHKKILALLVAQSLLVSPLCLAQPKPAATDSCGEVMSVETHDQTNTRYALTRPAAKTHTTEAIALVLLVGGSGHVDLDPAGCPRALKGNSLIRSIALFRTAGFFTALVDAPSDRHDEDGLGGFRIDQRHAADLGKVIADLRTRTKARVWIVGTSRGTISAVNAASRLTGPAAPDGIVLTSALMTAQSGARKAWVAQSVFDLQLESIRMPVLIVGHASDTCTRSPANRMGEIAARIGSERKQVVTVSGGQENTGSTSLAACEGKSPHGFIGQEAEVADGMARFIRGGRY